MTYQNMNDFELDEVIEAVRVQREASNAYCRALEQKIERLEGRLRAREAQSYIDYKFLTDRRPDAIEEYVTHCIEFEGDENEVGIIYALESLDDKSKTANEWLKKHWTERPR